MNNTNGKTLTIFIVLITILLVSSTAIGFFMYQKESQKRQEIEVSLRQSVEQQQKLAGDLKDAKSQLDLLDDKNKEADKKINNLMDEVELNEGLRNELKKENSELKESLELAKKEKELVRADLEGLAKKLQENLGILKFEQDKAKELQTKLQGIEEFARKQNEVGDKSLRNKMELDRIVVGQEGNNSGRVLSVDKESEFVICSLGTAQGFKQGDILAVYRGDQYLGDVKISRAQDEMSAADFIPPLTSIIIRKNDTVVLKKS
jgi:uncharacterized protein YigA (DUF484 family)